MVMLNFCNNCGIKDLCILKSLSFKAKILTPSDHLCRQGDELKSLFIVRSGLLKSYAIKENGDEFIMGFHFPGQLLGWDLFHEGKSLLSISAVEDSNICEIPIEEFTSLIHSKPETEWKVFELISKQIKLANEVLLRTSAEQRVAHFLMDLSRQYKPQKALNICKTAMTHQDMANYLRIAPETISRIFRRLQNNKVIKINKKEITICDWEKLQRLEAQ